MKWLALLPDLIILGFAVWAVSIFGRTVRTVRTVRRLRRESKAIKHLFLKALWEQRHGNRAESVRLFREACKLARAHSRKMEAFK